jgi:hypothetical protein
LFLDFGYPRVPLATLPIKGLPLEVHLASSGLQGLRLFFQLAFELGALDLRLSKAGNLLMDPTEFLDQPASTPASLAIGQSQAGRQLRDTPAICVGLLGADRRGRLRRLIGIRRGEPSRVEDLQLDLPQPEAIAVDQLGIREGLAV